MTSPAPSTTYALATSSTRSARPPCPEAITCALESDSFEDAIRNAISLGGDSDTLAAIAGPIAEALHGIPADIQATAEARYIPADILSKVREMYGTVARFPYQHYSSSAATRPPSRT